jgi:hypothetical protein
VPDASYKFYPCRLFFTIEFPLLPIFLYILFLFHQVGLENPAASRAAELLQQKMAQPFFPERTGFRGQHQARCARLSPILTNLAKRAVTSSAANSPSFMNRK